MWLVTLVKLRYKTCSQGGAFPLPCCSRGGMNGLNESHTAVSSRENIQLLQSYIVTYRKKLKEVAFVEEEFLYKKLSKKDVYVDYASTADMAEDAVEQYQDLTLLKQVKQNYYYSYVSQQSSFEWFLFSPWFWWGCKTSFCFSLHYSRPSFCKFVSFSLAIYVMYLYLDP